MEQALALKAPLVENVTEKAEYSVSVRGLVEFVLRTGDLGGATDFVRPSRALEGTRGHQRIQRSRPPGYQAEVKLSTVVETDEFNLRIQGRIDGLLPALESILIEEIKTVASPWDGEADPLHWAQLKIYGYLYSQIAASSTFELQLTYLNLDSGAVTEFRDRSTGEELRLFFQQTVEIYVAWLREYHHWRILRDDSIRRLEFPFAEYRPGQRQFAVAVYRALTQGQTLFAEAPTGIGKTISAIFPTIKALEDGGFARFFYLTAKTIGRTVAETALAVLRERGLRLRTVTLTAKEKICFGPTRPCDTSSCPFAIGYYDRLKAALAAALSREAMTRPVLEEIAQAHQVCPHELSLDLIPWSEGVICDYNYVFDPRVSLKRSLGDDADDYVLLVDEAHNLVERAREMYSAELNRQALLEAKRALQASLPAYAKILGRISRHLKGAQVAVAEDSNAYAGTLFSEEPVWAEKSQISRALPEELLALLRSFLHEAEQWLVQNRPAEFRQALLDIYFQITGFVRTAEIYDERFVTILEHEPQNRVRLFCLDPSALLRDTVKRSCGAVFFSATLTPMEYYRDVLGGLDQNPLLSLRSPFPRENLCVLVQDRVRTNWKDRASSYLEVAQAIAAMVNEKKGNYLVYFPSYHYLEAVREQFSTLQTPHTTLIQVPAMTESQRERFLSRFQSTGNEPVIGFAVMGGIFGEGIDLTGERLIGAVIVGVGLPQVCLERELIRDFFQEKRGNGFDFAYTFPGMNRVLQAVGRVIRSETDRGAVLLLDRRFSHPRHRSLFPAWWITRGVRSNQEISEHLQRFWKSHANS